MTAADKVIRGLVRSNLRRGETEKGYWRRHWLSMLQYFDRNKAPFEEVDAWERGCDREMARAYQKLFGGVEGKTILELGCGGGHISALLAAHARHVTLVDVVPQAIEYAQRTADYLNVADKITFIEGDFFHMAMKSHDICYNCGVLEHFEDEQAIEILRRMAGLAHETAAVTVPNLLSPELIYKMVRYGKASERYMTPQSVTELISRAKLQLVDCEAVNYWTPSVLGAGLAKFARRTNLVKRFWRLGWLFTCTFKIPVACGNGCQRNSTDSSL